MSTIAIQPGRRQRGSARASAARIAAVVAACLLVSFLVVQETRAAFTGQTANTSNAFNTGSVSLTDDDAGSAMFAVTNMRPGETHRQCIEVEYTGSIIAGLSDVRLYAAPSGQLADYLTVDVDAGSGGSFGSCSGFAPSAAVYHGFASAMGSGFASGHGTGWTPASTGDSRVMRFDVTLDDTVPDTLQGATATVEFTWEVRTL
jgi:hypothetical protein